MSDNWDASKEKVKGNSREILKYFHCLCMYYLRQFNKAPVFHTLQPFSELWLQLSEESSLPHSEIQLNIIQHLYCLSMPSLSNLVRVCDGINFLCDKECELWLWAVDSWGAGSSRSPRAQTGWLRGKTRGVTHLLSHTFSFSITCLHQQPTDRRGKRIYCQLAEHGVFSP